MVEQLARTQRMHKRGGVCNQLSQHRAVIVQAIAGLSPTVQGRPSGVPFIFELYHQDFQNYSTKEQDQLALAIESLRIHGWYNVPLRSLEYEHAW